jgi:hypothetical protein
MTTTWCQYTASCLLNGAHQLVRLFSGCMTERWWRVRGKRLQHTDTLFEMVCSLFNDSHQLRKLFSVTKTSCQDMLTIWLLITQEFGDTSFAPMFRSFGSDLAVHFCVFPYSFFFWYCEDGGGILIWNVSHHLPLRTRAHQGNWQPQRDRIFREMWPISNRQLVSRLAGAHWENLCLICC